ncbi:NF038122 family metalloprotease [Accumulibacter sp.]|uniref:NF038122 family metalloprotease n=1 Tax=Accumulibacter sp. TaxID=2053492 RepID=UPI0025D9FAC3|nr:NF038122 family metalloprotease [Accumulibacter sp.]MCM8595266.1 NF038122 family metalloprotease [Accumulibacter sp.]MDS4049412.1 NF038122 family metalloprotease [Accumulibacter sp.]
MPVRILSVVAAALLQLAAGVAHGGLVFNFTSTGDPRADAAFAMAGARDKYFSIDGGITRIARFATGVHSGDGRQASHWKDDFGIGIMDPTESPGESLVISPTDIRALDVIGWDLAGLSVSEPDGLSLFLIVVLAARMVGRRRRPSAKVSVRGRTCKGSRQSGAHAAGSTAAARRTERQLLGGRAPTLAELAGAAISSPGVPPARGARSSVAASAHRCSH